MASKPDGPATQDAYTRLLEATLRGCDIARQSAAALARSLGTPSQQFVSEIRNYEEELDTLDHEINDSVTSAICQAPEARAREMLACLKFILELERIGDLLLNVANRASAVAGRLDEQDKKNLITMASIVAKMLGEVQSSFADRDLRRALAVLKADAELDRLRNLMFVRHTDNPDNEPRHESFHVLFMGQALERSGDHAKNLAEEICHLVSGRSVRHLLRQYDLPDEKVFVERLRRQAAPRK